VTVAGDVGEWRVLLRNIGAVSTVVGGSASPDQLGTLIVPAPGMSQVEVVL
jgi:hypothetical protein